MSDRIYGYLIECIVEPDNGGFYAHCPGLGGVHAGGATEEEALANAYHAALAIIEAHLKQGEPVPEGPHLSALHKPPVLPDIGQLMPRPPRRPKGKAHPKGLFVPVAG